MHSIPLGSSGSQASAVALGTWTFAGDAIWGDSEEQQCERVVHAAIDRGIDLFDTAPNYGAGRSERILGKALRGRSDVRVATKFKVDGKTPAELRTMVEESLKRLQRDTVDLMQIHWPAPSAKESLEAIEVLEGLQDEGLVRHLGVCNFGVFDLEETQQKQLVTNQIPHSLLWRVVEGDGGIAQMSRSLNRTTYAYSVLQQGLLTGRYRSLEDFPEGRKRTRHFSSQWPGTRHDETGLEKETESTLSALFDVGRRFDRSMIELALAFTLSREGIDGLLLGARTVEQLHRSCEAAETSLAAEELRALEDATATLRRAVGENPDMYLSQSRIRYRNQRE